MNYKFPTHMAERRAVRQVTECFTTRITHIIGGGLNGPESIIGVKLGHGVQIAKFATCRDDDTYTKVVTETELEYLKDVFSTEGKNLMDLLDADKAVRAWLKTLKPGKRHE